MSHCKHVSPVINVLLITEHAQFPCLNSVFRIFNIQKHQEFNVALKFSFCNALLTL